MILQLSADRFSSAGRITLRVPIHSLDGNKQHSSLFAERWVLLTEAELGLEQWVGIGDRPRQGYAWCELDAEGRLLRIVPAENVVGFVAHVVEVGNGAGDTEGRDA